MGIYHYPHCVAFKRCSIEKNDYWDELAFGNVQQTLERFDVGIVLLQRIAELIFVPIHVLNPKLGLVIPINPACIVFGLNYIYSIPRYDNMAYLYGAALNFNINIIKNVIFAR